MRAVRAPARDVSSHTRVFFATCTHQFTTHLITNKPYQAHTSDKAPHTVSHQMTGSCCTKRDDMLTPGCRATDTMPRRTTLLPAIPSRTDSRSTRPHIRDAPRARVPDVCYTRGRTLNALCTMCAHPFGYIDEAPLHYPRTIPSSRVTKSSANWVELCPGSCVHLRVGAAFWRGFHRLMSRRCSFFSQRIRLNGSDVHHACILFGVLGVDLQRHG